MKRIIFGLIILIQILNFDIVWAQSESYCGDIPDDLYPTYYNNMSD